MRRGGWSTGEVDGKANRLLAQDLNEGAGGKYLWIYYRLGPDGDPAVTPINRVYTVNTSDNEHDRFGGTKINIDLNKGAGGDYIYLYYTKDFID